MRTFVGVRYLTSGARERNPAKVVLGSGILMWLILRRLTAKKESRVFRRRLRRGQGVTVRVVSPGTPPPLGSRRVR